MPKSLYLKLTLAFIVVALATAGLVALFIRITSVDRLSRLVIDQQRSTMENALLEYYSTSGSWSGVQQRWFQIMRSAEGEAGQVVQTGPGTFNGPPNHEVHRNLFGLADASGTWIVPLQQADTVGANVPPGMLQEGTIIIVRGQPVGTLITANRLPGYNPAEMLFLARTNQALILAVVVALLVALLIGIFLARTLTRPLLELTRAAENVAAGELQQQVAVHSNDEIGELATAFNKMSQEVSRVNQLRRQMTADVAHDLRTPLTVIAGYVESMRDGVLSPTPERLDLIYGEIERLQNLVGDLRMLSQADSGELQLNRQSMDIKAFLEHSSQVFQLRAGQQDIHLVVETQPGLNPLSVDEARMLQVMDNLLSNAFRYTPRGGRIILSARQLDGQVEITVADTGSGIPAGELPHIFERFRRADPSRHAEMGETGLGLAIVRAIVEAHQGTVTAESTSGSGTRIRILLPA